MCNNTTHDRIQFPVHKAAYHCPQAHLWMSFFYNSLFAELPHLLLFSSQLLWFFKSGSAQLSMKYMIQTDALSCSYFPNPWIFSSSMHLFSLFCFFCSLEPGFFLFLHTYCACCKHLLICNLPSETDCLFLCASSIHSLFSNLNQKHRFFSLCCVFYFFVLSALCLNALISSLYNVLTQRFSVIYSPLYVWGTFQAVLFMTLSVNRAQ